jgi:hypothetical protein
VGKKDIIIAILAGILTSLAVFTVLNVAAIIFPIEAIITLHSVVFALALIIVFYIFQRRNIE